MPNTFENRAPLSETEKKYPSAVYYDQQPTPIGVLENMILNEACPVPEKNAIQAEDWLQFLDHLDTYSDAEYGYCMLDEKRGYLANYLYWSHITPEMNGWWYRWINIHPKDVTEEGSLHYKIWYPGEHFDHGYINGKDRSDGYICKDYNTEGTLITTYRYPLKLTDLGVSQKKIDELTAQGFSFDTAWEQGEGGMRLSLNTTRKLPNGDMEKRTRTWIGYGIVDGRVVKDENACCTEKMLRDTLYHQSVEGRYLDLLLPELYQRFGDLPGDEV